MTNINLSVLADPLTAPNILSNINVIAFDYSSHYSFWVPMTQWVYDVAKL